MNAEIKAKLQKYMKQDGFYDIPAILRDEGYDELAAGMIAFFGGFDEDTKEPVSELRQAAMDANAARRAELDAADPIITVKFLVPDPDENGDNFGGRCTVEERQMRKSEYEAMKAREAAEEAKRKAAEEERQRRVAEQEAERKAREEAEAAERKAREEERKRVLAEINCKIKSINVWKKNDETRIYVNLKNGQVECYYLTGNKWHAANAWDGLTPELHEQARKLAFYADADGTARWHTIRDWEMADAILARLVAEDVSEQVADANGVSNKAEDENEAEIERLEKELAELERRREEIVAELKLRRGNATVTQ